MDDIFSDDELDEYLKSLLEQQQRQYELSKAYMADDKKISDEEWERIFQEQVAFHFRTKGLTGDELDAAVADKLTQARNNISGLSAPDKLKISDQPEQFENAIDNVMLDVARQVVLDDSKKEFAIAVSNMDDVDETTRDKLMKDFDANRRRLEKEAQERRRAQQEALRQRLALRNKLEEQGLNSEEMDTVLNEYDQRLAGEMRLINEGNSEFYSLDNQQLELTLQEEEIAEFDINDPKISARLAKAERNAKKEAKKSKMNTENTDLLIRKLRAEEEEKLRAEGERRKKQQKMLADRLAARKTRATQMAENEAELVVLKEAEKMKIEAEEKKRLQLLEREKHQFKAALAAGDLQPNQVYKFGFI